MFIPSEKFGGREHADSSLARHRSQFGFVCRQPVVPITTLMPRRASSGRFCGTASASVKSIATSTGPKSASLDRRSASADVRMPAMLAPYPGASDSTSLPHPAVTDKQKTHRMLREARGRGHRREELLMQPAERAGQVGFAESRR